MHIQFFNNSCYLLLVTLFALFAYK